MTAVYEPSRALPAKIGRRFTQWRAANAGRVTPLQPVLSVSFDDFPSSAAREGLPVLADAGVRATFYACAGLKGRESPFGPLFTEDDIAAVGAAGHDIACHTHSHLDCAQAPPAAVLAECDRNAESLSAMGVRTPLRHMAYPYGETTFALKQALRPRFATARGILPGLNRGRVDAMQLRAVSLYGEHAAEVITPWLEAAARRPAWLILFTHDVADQPSRFGTTPKALAATLKTATDLGFVIAPVGEAADQLLKDAA